MLNYHLFLIFPRPWYTRPLFKAVHTLHKHFSHGNPKNSDQEGNDNRTSVITGKYPLLFHSPNSYLQAELLHWNAQSVWSNHCSLHPYLQFRFDVNVSCAGSFKVHIWMNFAGEWQWWKEKYLRIWDLSRDHSLWDVAHSLSYTSLPIGFKLHSGFLNVPLRFCKYEGPNYLQNPFMLL